MDFKVSNNNIHVENSHLVSKHDIPGIIKSLLTYANTLHYEVGKRSAGSCCREWYVHNLLYNLHILRSRTGSVDLDTPQTLPFRVGYSILGIFAWILIK